MNAAAPGATLLTDVLVSEHTDHLSVYRHLNDPSLVDLSRKDGVFFALSCSFSLESYGALAGEG